MKFVPVPTHGAVLYQSIPGPTNDTDPRSWLHALALLIDNEGGVHVMTADGAILAVGGEVQLRNPLNPEHWPDA